MRILITGGPGTGKSFLASELSKHEPFSGYVSTDALVSHIPWEEQSEYIASRWFVWPGPWVIEGVTVPRALRRWLRDHDGSEAKPCDKLIICRRQWRPLEKRGQRSMAKAVETVLQEVLPALRRLGVEIEERSQADERA